MHVAQFLKMLKIETIDNAEEYLQIILNHFENEKKNLEISRSDCQDDYYRANSLINQVKRMIVNKSDDGRYCIRNTQTNRIELFAISPSATHSTMHSMVIGYGDIESTLLLADFFIEQFPHYTIPRLTANKDLATTFSERYCQTTKLSEASCLRQLFHVLIDYEPPHRSVPGRLIQADESHLELLIQWVIQYSIDAKLPRGKITRDYAERLMSTRVREGTVSLWIIPTIDGGERPVSMTVATIIDDMVRFGSVYTPEDERGHGYASILVNLLTKQFLDEGKVCTLYTDADNPVSNSIYYKIGYRVISDERIITFTKPEIV